MAITASMVKELRDSTCAGMMDAKKALTENNGDMEAAIAEGATMVRIGTAIFGSRD